MCFYDLECLSSVLCGVVRTGGVGPATVRSQVRIAAAALHVMTMGKLFTHTSLCSQSSIIWYRRKLGASRDTLAPCPWTCGFGWCLAEGY